MRPHKIVRSILLAAILIAPISSYPFYADDIPKLLKQAAKHARRGSLPEAEKILRIALAASPRNSIIETELAYVLARQRKLNDAYNLSFNVAKSEPNNARAFAVLGYTLLNAGRFEEAKPIFNNALHLDRKEDLAWAGSGMLDFYENRIFDSLVALQEAVYLKQSEPDYWFMLAQVSARAERYNAAAAHYERFLSIAGKFDRERSERIKGLISFLRYIGSMRQLYSSEGEEQTTVPMRLLGSRPVIQVYISDKKKPLNFVLDTGSGISVISFNTAKRLKIDPVARGGHARGLGGDGKFEIVYGFLRKVRIGDVQILNVPVYIREFHSVNEEIDGYIGLSLISKFLTTIDYGKLTFSLLKKDIQQTSESSNAVSLPLRLTSSGFLSGEVQVEGIESPLNFIVDTGASVSVISDRVASIDEVKNFVQPEKMRVIGAAGITGEVPSYLLPKVSFGKHSRKSITAIALDLDMINEASGFEQAGILGGNFLRNYSLTFDFQNSKVTFVPVVPDK